MYRNKEKKIPTLFALLIIFFGIWGIRSFDRNTPTTQSQALESILPREIIVTNVSDSSFTVTWLTPQNTTGKIQLMEGIRKTVYSDDLDNDNISRLRKNHSVTIDNLKENNEYSLKLLNGDNCKDDKQCPVIKQKTGPMIDANLNLSPPHGIVTYSNDKPADTVLIYILMEKTSPLSTRTDSAGLWAIPLTNVRDQDLYSKANIADNDVIQIVVKFSPSETAEAIIDMKSIRQNLTIPTIKIGNSYNFIDLLSKKNMFAGSRNGNILGLNTESSLSDTKNLSLPSSNNSKIDLYFPAINSETTTDNRPRIRGIGIPGKEIHITVNSSPQSGKITVSTDGSWVWRPPNSLSPGEHYVNIQGYDENGKIINIKRKFFVLKSGESVLGEATPSGTIIPSPTDVINPTPIIISPTLTVSPQQPSPTRFLPTFTPIQPPRTGDIKPILIVLTGSISILLLGIKLTLFS